MVWPTLTIQQVKSKFKYQLSANQAKKPRKNAEAFLFSILCCYAAIGIFAVNNAV